MTLQEIRKEAEEIAVLVDASKADAMIYQAEAKRELAKLNGVPENSYYYLPYEKWVEIYKASKCHN